MIRRMMKMIIIRRNFHVHGPIHQFDFSTSLQVDDDRSVCRSYRIKPDHQHTLNLKNSRKPPSPSPPRPTRQQAAGVSAGL